MRLIVGLLFCFVASAAFAQTPFLPFVQIGQASSGSTCTFANPVVNGNILLVSSSWEATNATPTVSDTRTSSYSQAVADINPVNFIKAAIYVATAASSGANTVTFSESGATFQWTACAELSSSVWTTVVDASDGTTLTGTPASITSNTLSTTMNKDFIWAHVGGTQSGGVFGIGAGYSYAGIQGGHDSAAEEFRVAGNNGSYTSSFSTSVNTDVTLVTIALRPVSIAFQSPALLPDGALSKSYNYTLLAVGGTGAYTWSITSGSLQAGLSLNASTGAITGTPLSSSNNSITFQVTDGTHTTTLATTLKIGATLNTPTFVQAKGPPTNGGSSPTLAFTSSVASGDVLLVAMISSAAVPCTDSVGTIYRNMYFDFAGATSNLVPISIQAGYAGGSGANTVTCNATTGIFSLAEFSNVQLFGIDNVVSSKGTSASPISSATLTTLVPNELLYALDVGVSAGTVLTAQAPFTDIGPNFSFDAGYQAVTTVTGYTSSFTMATNADGHWNTFLAGLRPTGGAVSNNPIRHKAGVH